MVDAIEQCVPNMSLPNKLSLFVPIYVPVMMILRLGTVTNADYVRSKGDLLIGNAAATFSGLCICILDGSAT